MERTGSNSAARRPPSGGILLELLLSIGLFAVAAAFTLSALRTAVEAGFMTRNEAREELDLPPLPGLDEPTLALNVGTGGGSTNIGSDTSAEEGTPNDF